MAKYKKEYDNGTVKHTLDFRGKEFDFSMIPTFFGASSDKKCFSAQLAETFPDIDEDDLDMIDCLSDDDEVIEALSVLENLEQFDECKINNDLSDEERENPSVLLSDTKMENAKKVAVTNFAVAVLSEVAECARQEDSPLYEGDKEVDCFVRLSDVNEVINKYLNEQID